VTVRGTLGLLAALAVLVLYLVAVDAPPAPPRPPEAPLLAVPAADATTVDLTWPDAHLHAVRRDGAWHADDPAVLPAGMVDDLLAALATIRPIDTLTASATDATDYGFGSGGTTLVVSTRDAPVLRLQVGDRNPAWTGIYVRRTGSMDVLLVGALLHWELEKLHTMATR